MSGRLRSWVLLLALTLGGCANLNVHKVSLEDRHSGRDMKLDGFRYYLPRPYVIVAARIEVAKNYAVGTLKFAKLEGEPIPEPGKEEKLMIQPVIEVFRRDPTENVFPLFDLKGNPLPVAIGDGPGWKVLPAETNAILLSAIGKEKQFDPTQLEKQFGELAKSVAELKKMVEAAKLTGPAVQVPSQIQLTMNQVSTTNSSGSGVESGPKIQIAMLPDFEEQMRIKDCNFLAWSKYGLAFKDGWQLAGVQGSWDSTEVPVRILQSVSKAISAAAAIKKKALSTLPISPAELREFRARKGNLDDPFDPVLITVTEYIPPGVYRLNKPREMDRVICNGLLTELGLPTEHERKVQRLDMSPAEAKKIP